MTDIAGKCLWAVCGMITLRTAGYLTQGGNFPRKTPAIQESLLKPIGS